MGNDGHPGRLQVHRRIDHAAETESWTFARTQIKGDKYCVPNGVTGFFSGSLLGATYGSPANRLRHSARTRRVLSSLAIGLPAFAWLSAPRAQLQ